MERVLSSQEITNKDIYMIITNPLYDKATVKRCLINL